MTSKKVIFMCSFLCFPFTIHSMEDSCGQPKHALTRRPSDERITIISENDPKGKKVPNLDLASVKEAKTVQSSSSQTPKTPVTQFEELGRKVQRAKSIRSSQSTKYITRRRMPIDDSEKSGTVAGSVLLQDEKDIRIPIEDEILEPQKRISLLPRALVQGVVGQPLPDEKKHYSEEEVWAMLELFNPPLCSFGKHHKMDLEELRAYSELADDLEIHPQVIIELVQKDNKSNSGLLDILFGDANNQQEAFLNKKYEKIKDKQSEQYKLLVFEALKAASDHVDGNPHRSAIADTHIKLQNDEINSQRTQIRQQYIGMALELVGMMGALAFAIYGQVENTPCPGNSTG